MPFKYKLSKPSAAFNYSSFTLLNQVRCFYMKQTIVKGNNIYFDIFPIVGDTLIFRDYTVREFKRLRVDSAIKKHLVPIPVAFTFLYLFRVISVDFLKINNYENIIKKDTSLFALFEYTK